MIYKIKRFSHNFDKMDEWELMDYVEKNPKSLEEIENIDNPKLRALYIRYNNSKNILPNKKEKVGKIHQSQTNNVNISKDYCLDWENCDKDGYVPIKPKENKLKIVGLVGASILAGIGLYHGAKKLYKKYKKYKINRANKKNKNQKNKKEED